MHKKINKLIYLLIANGWLGELGAVVLGWKCARWGSQCSKHVDNVQASLQPAVSACPVCLSSFLSVGSVKTTRRLPNSNISRSRFTTNGFERCLLNASRMQYVLSTGTGFWRSEACLANRFLGEPNRVGDCKIIRIKKMLSDNILENCDTLKNEILSNFCYNYPLWSWPPGPWSSGVPP